MSLSRLSPVRILSVFTVVLGLAFTMFAGYTLSPAAPKASATVITAAKASNAVKWAASRRGSPYQYGATGPHRFDCSGLTRWAYARVGKALPHSSSAQASKVKRLRYKKNRRRGDLVFFYGGGGIYHVGIYAGRNKIWHASQPGTPVRKSAIWTSAHFYGRLR
jgi:cell wall-associated NlpC family hydrolase